MTRSEGEYDISTTKYSHQWIILDNELIITSNRSFERLKQQGNSNVNKLGRYTPGPQVVRFREVSKGLQFMAHLEMSEFNHAADGKWNSETRRQIQYS